LIGLLQRQDGPPVVEEMTTDLHPTNTQTKDHSPWLTKLNPLNTFPSRTNPATFLHQASPLVIRRFTAEK